jgi:hypothetical protein
MEKRFHQYHVHYNNTVYDYLSDDDYDDDDDSIVHNFELRLTYIYILILGCGTRGFSTH